MIDGEPSEPRRSSSPPSTASRASAAMSCSRSTISSASGFTTRPRSCSVGSSSACAAPQPVVIAVTGQRHDRQRLRGRRQRRRDAAERSRDARRSTTRSASACTSIADSPPIKGRGRVVRVADGGPARARVRADLQARSRAPDPFHLRPPTRGAGSNPRPHRLGTRGRDERRDRRAGRRRAPPGRRSRPRRPRRRRPRRSQPQRRRTAAKPSPARTRARARARARARRRRRRAERRDAPARARSGSPGQGLGRPRRLRDRRVPVLPRRRAASTRSACGRLARRGGRLHGRVGDAR